MNILEALIMLYLQSWDMMQYEVKGSKLFNQIQMQKNLATTLNAGS